VLIEGFRPGVLDRLGVGHAALLALHPGLIVCAITGYGQDGPLAKRAGHDLNYLARAGVLGVTGPADQPPAVSGAQMADVAGGALWAVVAILAALQERSRTGVGCVADIAMSEGAVPLATFALASLFAGERPRPRGDNVLDGGIAAYATYLTADRQRGGPRGAGAEVLDRLRHRGGARPSLDALVPGSHQPALKASVAAVIAGRTRAEWEAFSRSHDCCIEPVLEPHELPGDAQHQHRGVFFETEGFGGGPMLAFRTPVGPGAAQAHTPPRAAGADTREILREAGHRRRAHRRARGLGRDRSLIGSLGLRRGGREAQPRRAMGSSRHVDAGDHARAAGVGDEALAERPEAEGLPEDRSQRVGAAEELAVDAARHEAEIDLGECTRSRSASVAPSPSGSVSSMSARLQEGPPLRASITSPALPNASTPTPRARSARISGTRSSSTGSTTRTRDDMTLK
jgi:alpha-methylacyl-CoA racemase